MTNGNGKRLKFPHKLFDMLERTTGDPLWSGVVSWSASGRAFDIKDRDGLCDILPEFFRQNKFKSFTRQLNLWGFRRANPSSDRWHHDRFVRGDRSGLDAMAYVKVKGGTKGDGPRNARARRLAFLAASGGGSSVRAGDASGPDGDDDRGVGDGGGGGGGDAPNPKPTAQPVPSAGAGDRFPRGVGGERDAPLPGPAPEARSISGVGRGPSPGPAPGSSAASRPPGDAPRIPPRRPARDVGLVRGGGGGATTSAASRSADDGARGGQLLPPAAGRRAVPPSPPGAFLPPAADVVPARGGTAVGQNSRARGEIDTMRPEFVRSDGAPIGGELRPCADGPCIIPMTALARKTTPGTEIFFRRVFGAEKPVRLEDDLRSILSLDD